MRNFSTMTSVLGATKGRKTLYNVYISKLEELVKKHNAECERLGVSVVKGYKESGDYVPLAYWLMFCTAEVDVRYTSLRKAFIEKGVSVLEGSSEVVLDGVYIQKDLAREILGITEESIGAGSFSGVLPLHRHLGGTYIHYLYVRYYALLLEHFGVYGYRDNTYISDKILRGTVFEEQVISKTGVSPMGERLAYGKSYESSSLAQVESALMKGKVLSSEFISKTWMPKLFILGCYIKDINEVAKNFDDFIQSKYSIIRNVPLPPNHSEKSPRALQYSALLNGVILQKDIATVLGIGQYRISLELFGKSSSRRNLGIISTDAKDRLSFSEWMYFQLVMLDAVRRLRYYLGLEI